MVRHIYPRKQIWVLPSDLRRARPDGYEYSTSDLDHILTPAAVRATALYPYTGNNPDELPFAEGDTLAVIDHSDADWWKVEQDGLVFIVPAGYVGLAEG